MAPVTGGTEKTAELDEQTIAGVDVIGPTDGPLLGVTINVSLGPTPHPFVPCTMIVPGPVPAVALSVEEVLLPDHPVPNTVHV